MTHTQPRSSIRVSKSGRFMVQFVTPEGWSSTTEVDTHAQAIAAMSFLRGQINNPAPPQRGPAADRREPI